MMQSIKGTSIGHDERRQIAIQDRVQAGEHFGCLDAASLDRGLTFCDIVPAQLLRRKHADPGSLFPFPIAARDRTRRAYDRDFRNEEI